MDIPAHHQDAFKALKGKKKRKIGNNTWLVSEEGPNIGIVLHDTTIVRFAGVNRIEFNTGGYNTVTTRSRMNAVIRPMGWWLWGTSRKVGGLSVKTHSLPFRVTYKVNDGRTFALDRINPLVKYSAREYLNYNGMLHSYKPQTLAASFRDWTLFGVTPAITQMSRERIRLGNGFALYAPNHRLDKDLERYGVDSHLMYVHNCDYWHPLNYDFECCNCGEAMPQETKDLVSFHIKAKGLVL